MPQTGRQDLEGDGNPGQVPGHRDQPQLLTLNQPTPNYSLGPPQGEPESLPDYGDSSWPLYCMYSKIAEEEDHNMVECSHKDTDGTLIFSGLFSATVGALLTLSIPDLKPNSQNTSAFYLEKIYKLSGDTNASLPSIPSALANPSGFSPPGYAIWVNSLWFLSLAVSISCAMEALIIRNWAVQYISVTQPPRYTTEKQARVRAIFANGSLGPKMIWGTTAAPIFLHASLFLFVAGGLIYLFNINRTVFYAVVWWVGFMIIEYSIGTVAALFEPHNLLRTPLSSLALRFYLVLSCAAFRICSHIPLHGLRENTKRHYHDLNNRYGNGLLNGRRREAEEIASKPSSKIDALILGRILLTLNEDHGLETFFDAIPGFCNSKLSDLPLSFPLQSKLQQALDGFLNRTFSSNLISESVRTGRLITCLNAAHAALGPNAISGILDNIFNGQWDEALKSVELGHALRLWGHGRDRDLDVRRILARIIARVRRRDDSWTILVKDAFDVPDRVLRDSLAHGDSVLLSILIHTSSQINRAGSWTSGILSSLSKFDIRNTLPELQHGFCTLWNKIADDARDQASYSTPVMILREIRHLYVALHQGTDAAPTAFSASTDSLHFILYQQSSYPSCNIASHHPDSTAHIPVPNSHPVSLLTQLGDSPAASPHHYTSGGGTVSRQVTKASTIARPRSPSDPTAPVVIGDGSQAATATSTALSVHSSPPPTDASPPGAIAAALKDTPSAPTLSHPLEGTTQDIVAPRAEPDIGEILSIGSITAPAPPASSVIGFAGPGSRPPSRVSLLQITNLIALLSGTAPSHPIDSDTLPRLRARGLENNENNCFANAVLQLLVHCPPFWNLFRDLGRLMGKQGLGESQETGGGTTPLVNAKVKFLDEFVYEDTLLVMQKLQKKATTWKARENEEVKKEHDVVDSFNPRYMYDVMKEKSQLKHLLDGKHQDAEQFLGLYLDTLDEELLELHNYASTHKPASAIGVEELEEDAQSAEGQIELGRRGYTASSVQSPISRMFGLRSRRLLKLNIQPDSVHTIQDALALAHVSHSQVVQVGQSSSSETGQQVHIEALPPVLVLHLKRFLNDVAAGGIVKISKPVHFEPELKIMALESAEPAHYKLYGVLYHHGESASGGHYTVDVLHPNGDGGSGETWLHIHDEVVTTVRHDDVFGGHDNEQDDRCAYMLFYCRTAPAQAK